MLVGFLGPLPEEWDDGGGENTPDTGACTGTTCNERRRGARWCAVAIDALATRPCAPGFAAKVFAVPVLGGLGCATGSDAALGAASTVRTDDELSMAGVGPCHCTRGGEATCIVVG